MKRPAKKLQVLKQGNKLDQTLSQEDLTKVSGGKLTTPPQSSHLGCGGPHDCVAVQAD
jgi:hypothetical protein